MSLDKTIKDLDQILEEQYPETIRRVSKIRGKETTIHQFHGDIGGKNRIFADTIQNTFPSPEQFFSEWLEGFLKHRKKEILEGKAAGSSKKIAGYLRDDKILYYIKIFLKRNFYKNYKARTRTKAPEYMWSVYLGDNPNCWEINLSPVIEEDTIRVDRSEMIRALYNFWTVGHLLSTGIIDHDKGKVRVRRFRDIEDYRNFMIDVFRKRSRSQYEKIFIDEYFDYLKTLNDQTLFDTPLLIPEYRYGDPKDIHSKRLDFVILNPYTMDFVGFELSPQSTHMSIKGKDKKTQKLLNEELKEQWLKEMSKRNQFCIDHGVEVLTFVDEHFPDMKQHFKDIVVPVLARRTQDVRPSEDVLRDVLELG